MRMGFKRTTSIYINVKTMLFIEKMKPELPSPLNPLKGGDDNAV